MCVSTNLAHPGFDRDLSSLACREVDPRRVVRRVARPRGLTQEQVRVAGDRDQVGPARAVPRVDQGPTLHLDAGGDGWSSMDAVREAQVERADLDGVPVPTRMCSKMSSKAIELSADMSPVKVSYTSAGP
jgi:hypothetical protein